MGKPYNQLSFHSLIINQSSLKALMKSDILVRTEQQELNFSYAWKPCHEATGVRLKRSKSAFVLFSLLFSFPISHSVFIFSLSHTTLSSPLSSNRKTYLWFPLIMIYIFPEGCGRKCSLKIQIPCLLNPMKHIIISKS